MANLENITPNLLVVLGEAGIKTRDDLADLAREELLEIVPEGTITPFSADEIIMKARAHWFSDDEISGGDENNISETLLEDEEAPDPQ